MEDLFGIGVGSDKLIGAVERALGAIFRPYGTRRQADADVYRLTALEDAKMNSKVRNTVEIAKAKVEAKLILADGDHELEDRMLARTRHEALKQQRNIDAIVTGALTQSAVEQTDEEVDDDWLTEFFERARCVSGEEMQRLWSRVLALEVGTPGSFSSRSLDVLRKMTRREAEIFQIACRLSSGYSPKSKRGGIWFGAQCYRWYSISEPPEVELHNFGLGLLNRVNMAHMGLLYEDDLVTKAFDRGEKEFISFASTKLMLTSKRKDVKLKGFAFTPIGSELAALIAPEEDQEYIDSLCNSLSKLFYISKCED